MYTSANPHKTNKPSKINIELQIKHLAAYLTQINITIPASIAMHVVTK